METDSAEAASEGLGFCSCSLNANESLCRLIIKDAV